MKNTTIKSIFLFFIILTGPNLYAKRNILYLVSVPDSISSLLDSTYTVLTNRDNTPCNAGVNIHNVINYKKTKFTNGLYSFGGMGPHFEKILFIYYNRKLYVISSNKLSDVLIQLSDAYTTLKLKREDYIKYVKHIILYIEQRYRDEYRYYSID